jgi:ribosomal protein S18 acetylase RimI-like enzyme
VIDDREPAPDPTDRPAVVIRACTPADLDRVADLHLAAFPESVLGRLGHEAVRRSYRWQMEGPHDLTAIVAEEGGSVAGFLFGGVFRGSTIGFLKREKWFLVRQVLAHPDLLLRHAGWDRIALAGRLLSRRFTTPSTIEEPAAVPNRSFGVLGIAVDPASQGSGVGRALMAEAEKVARGADFENMHLTVHPDNASAVAFYESLGWRRRSGPDGAWTGQMILPLGAGSARNEPAAEPGLDGPDPHR